MKTMSPSAAVTSLTTDLGVLQIRLCVLHLQLMHPYPVKIQFYLLDFQDISIYNSIAEISQQ
jgi:hypothetical protein